MIHFAGGSLARGIRVFTKIQIILRDGIVRIDAQQLLIMRLRALRIPLHKARVCELVQYVFVIRHGVHHLHERLLRLRVLLQVKLQHRNTVQLLRFQRANLGHLIQPRDGKDTIALLDFGERERAVGQNVVCVLAEQLGCDLLGFLPAVCDEIGDRELFANLHRFRRLALAVLQFLNRVADLATCQKRARVVRHRVVFIIVVAAQPRGFKHRVVVVDEIQKIFRVGGKRPVRLQLQIVLQAVRRAVIVLQAEIVAGKSKVAFRRRVFLIRHQAKEYAVALLKSLHLA